MSGSSHLAFERGVAHAAYLLQTLGTKVQDHGLHLGLLLSSRDFFFGGTRPLVSML